MLHWSDYPENYTSLVIMIDRDHWYTLLGDHAELEDILIYIRSNIAKNFHFVSSSCLDEASFEFMSLHNKLIIVGD